MGCQTKEHAGACSLYITVLLRFRHGDADLEEVYNTERHLLYVACTRARDHLLVTGITPVSEFVDDFLKGS